MLSNQEELRKMVSTAIRLLQEQGNYVLAKFLKEANVSSEVIHYDSWNGGVEYFAIYLEVDAALFTYYEDKLKETEAILYEKFELLLHGVESEQLSNITIKPTIKQYLDWQSVRISKDGLLGMLKGIKELLIKVATGGPKIQTVNDEYKDIYNQLDNTFKVLHIINPNSFKDLWDWYRRWSNGDLPSYQSRRTFINDMYSNVIGLIENSNDTTLVDQPYEITGWERVDRGVSEIRTRIREAEIEEQFQSIGLLSREAIISLAQEVYNPEIHIPTDKVKPSNTDANRMLDAFFTYELRGSSNEAYRKYAKSALTLANDLTHRRSADIHQASMCVIAVISLVNIVKVITNKSNIHF